MSEENSTIVRAKEPWTFRGLRGGFRVLNRVPAVGVPIADALFCTPTRMRLSPGGNELLSSGRRRQVTHWGRDVAVWTWGTGPSIYLVHGWGGRAAQLRAFVPPLLERGFSVVAFDLPAHGMSDGRRTSLIEAASALREVVDRIGPAHAIVAHSFGAPTVSLALKDGLKVDRLVFVGPAAEPVTWTHQFGETLGISQDVMEGMRRRTEGRLGFRWGDLSITRNARDRTQPLLVVHDLEDDEVAHTDGVEIVKAWPGARLLSTRGLGHRRILRDPDVVAAAVGFVSEGGGREVPADGAGIGLCERPGCDRPIDGSGASVCETCRLEAMLFDRETRVAQAFATRQ